MKIIIAGGNGFLGRVLCHHFSPQHEVIVLHRGEKAIKNGIRYENWDAKNEGSWKKLLGGADVLINLVGRSVDCRYNEKNKREILESRVNATRLLGQVISQCQDPPKVWINAASATIYRHSEDREMDEASGEIGSGFSVDVCKAWEKAFFEFDLPDTRRVVIRTSIVLGKQGGALKPLMNLARLGLGGRQGNGTQFFSWIHEDDFARATEFIMTHENLEGPVNVVSPKPVRNIEIMREIRKAVKVPFGIQMPKWVLEFGARIIRTETELVLKSRNVIPKKLTDAGFRFQFDQLKPALRHTITP